MSVLASAHLVRPEYFHKIAGPRFAKIVEVSAKFELVEKARGAWTICVPAAPDSFAIVLITNDELLESGEIEVQFSACAQRLDGSDKYEIGRA